MCQRADGQSAVRKLQQTQFRELAATHVKSATRLRLHHTSSMATAFLVTMAMTMAVLMITVMLPTLVCRHVRAAIIRSMRINNDVAILHGRFDFFFQPSDDRIQPHAIAQIGEKKWPAAPHLARIAIHHLERRPHIRRKVNLVNHQQIRPHNPWAAFARNFVTLGHVDHINPDIHQLRTERRAQIVAAAFNKYKFQARKTILKLSDSPQIHGSVLANRRVRTSARLHSSHSFGRQRPLPQQIFRVLFRVNVVRHDGKVAGRPQSLAQAVNKHCLSGSDGSRDSHSKGAARTTLLHVCVPSMRTSHPVCGYALRRQVNFSYASDSCWKIATAARQVLKMKNVAQCLQGASLVGQYTDTVAFLMHREWAWAFQQKERKHINKAARLVLAVSLA